MIRLSWRGGAARAAFRANHQARRRRRSQAPQLGEPRLRSASGQLGFGDRQAPVESIAFAKVHLRAGTAALRRSAHGAENQPGARGLRAAQARLGGVIIVHLAAQDQSQRFAFEEGRPQTAARRAVRRALPAAAHRVQAGSVRVCDRCSAGFTELRASTPRASP